MARIIPSHFIRCVFSSRAVLCAAALLVYALAGPRPGAAAGTHELDITLHPAEARLTGVADLDVSRYSGTRAWVLLAPEAAISAMRVDGRDARYERNGNRVAVAIPKNASTLHVEYACRFDDPVEEQPASMDNPGFGVMASISEKGAFLLPGSGWYPGLLEHGAHYTLTLRAPRGVYAVTTGKLLGHEDEGDASISRWDAWSPDDRLPLAAGKWIVQRSDDGPAPVVTYFSSKLAPLAGRYLDAASRHIAFFQELHGEYPFPQFAVVENFFPTGYGFPGFTLLGGRVLALPFIPETSLKHEVAHCWWGNGVLVDWEQGNWCEGLTSYVADYLSKEREGPEEALEYRLNTLRRYSLVVPPELDFPLTEFGSRTSPATQAVGYGKAMYVFHMLRTRVGDEAFWQALRDIYADHLFENISWGTFRETFAAPNLLGPEGAERFFAQWVERPGAASFRLEANRTEQGGGWRVEAGVAQREPAYDLTIPVVVRTRGGEEAAVVALSEQTLRDAVAISTQDEPFRVVADPDAQIFRRLAPEEVPATVDRLRGSSNLVAVVADSMPEEARRLAEWVLISLNQREAMILSEAEAERSLPENDVLFLGMPGSPGLRALVQATPAGSMYLESGTLPGIDAPGGADTVFFVDKRPLVQGDAPVTAVLALREGAGLDHMAPAARKLMHYGTYGCLIFETGEALAKGRWDVRNSPVTVRFEE